MDSGSEQHHPVLHSFLLLDTSAATPTPTTISDSDLLQHRNTATHSAMMAATAASITAGGVVSTVMSADPRQAAMNSGMDTTPTTGSPGTATIDQSAITSTTAEDFALRRRRISPAQLDVLRRVYNERTKYPVVSLRNELAEKLGLRPRMVQVWFQNQRQQEASKRREQQREQSQMRRFNSGVRLLHTLAPLPATPGHPLPSPSASAPPVTVSAPPSSVAAPPPRVESTLATPDLTPAPPQHISSAMPGTTLASPPITDPVTGICDGARPPPPLNRTADGRVVAGFALPGPIGSYEIFQPWSRDCLPSWHNSEPPSAKGTRRRRRVTVTGAAPSVPSILGSNNGSTGNGQSIRRSNMDHLHPYDEAALVGSHLSSAAGALRRRPRRASGPTRPIWAGSHRSLEVPERARSRASSLTSASSAASSPLAMCGIGSGENTLRHYATHHTHRSPPLSADAIRPVQVGPPMCRVSSGALSGHITLPPPLASHHTAFSSSPAAYSPLDSRSMSTSAAVPAAYGDVHNRSYSSAPPPPPSSSAVHDIYGPPGYDTSDTMFPSVSPSTSATTYFHSLREEEMLDGRSLPPARLSSQHSFPANTPHDYPQSHHPNTASNFPPTAHSAAMMMHRENGRPSEMAAGFARHLPPPTGHSNNNSNNSNSNTTTLPSMASLSQALPPIHGPPSSAAVSYAHAPQDSQHQQLHRPAYVHHHHHHSSSNAHSTTDEYASSCACCDPRFTVPTA